MKVRKILVQCKGCNRRVAYFFYERVKVCRYCGKVILMQDKLGESLTLKRDNTIIISRA